MKTQTISQLYVSKKAEVSKRDRTFRQQIEEAKLKKQDFKPLVAERVLFQLFDNKLVAVNFYGEVIEANLSFGQRLKQLKRAKKRGLDFCLACCQFLLVPRFFAIRKATAVNSIAAIAIASGVNSGTVGVGDAVVVVEVMVNCTVVWVCVVRSVLMNLQVPSGKLGTVTLKDKSPWESAVFVPRTVPFTVA